MAHGPHINPKAAEALKKFFKQVNFLFVVFMAGALVVLLGCLLGSDFGKQPSNPEAETIMHWSVPFLAMAQLFLSQFVYNSRIKRGKKAEKLYEKMDAYRGGFLLRFIVINSASLLGSIAFLMTGTWVFVGLSVLLLGIMFYFRPTSEKFIADLNLSMTETAVVRDHLAE